MAIITVIDTVTANHLAELGETFSVLCKTPGVRPFNPEVLAEEFHKLPGSALEAAAVLKFLLWLCPREHQGVRARRIAAQFDLIEAALFMRPRTLKALAAWMKSPWIPHRREAEHLVWMEERVLDLEHAAFVKDEEAALRAEGKEIVRQVLGQRW